VESTLKSISVRNVTYYVYVRKGTDSLSPSLIFLHGFTGSHLSFKHIYDLIDDRFTIIAPDLLGHGQTDSPNAVNRFESTEQVADIIEIIEYMGINKPVLIGYSMGARLALQVGVKHASKLSGLILESGTFGIRNTFDAEDRRRSDKELAQLIRLDFDAFLKKWEELPLFESKYHIPDELLSQVRIIRKSQRPKGLASSLLGFGTGSMPALFWKDLQKVTCPVLFITGELDIKFTIIADSMQKSIKKAEHLVSKDCGHRVHLESPNSYINAIKHFIKSI